MKRKGFSLVEVLVIIAILGLISVFGQRAYFKYTIRAKLTAAMHVLEEYQTNAIAQFDRKGSIDPYYVLFSAGDTTGLVSGSPGGTSAEKTLNLQYVDSITASTGTSGSNSYILLGVGMTHDNYFVANKDHLYMAGVIDPDGVITWSCGTSASQTDNMNADYLPNTCLNTLP